MLGVVAREGAVGVSGEQQPGALVFVQTFPEIVDIGFDDPVPLSILLCRDGRQLLLATGADVAVVLVKALIHARGESFVLALGDPGAGLFAAGVASCSSPAWLSALSSLSVWDEGLLEFALVLRVLFSMKTAISTESSISSAAIRARLSAVIFPSAPSCPKRPLSPSDSSRRDCLLTLATGGCWPASTAINPESTARRSAGGIAAQRRAQLSVLRLIVWRLACAPRSAPNAPDRA